MYPKGRHKIVFIALLVRLNTGSQKKSLIKKLLPKCLICSPSLHVQYSPGRAFLKVIPADGLSVTTGTAHWHS